MKKPQFAINHTYHIYNRGVEKRSVFLDDKDHFRFIHDLFEFNDKAPAGKFSKPKLSEVEPPIVKERKPVVEISTFCLMPNHFHLLLKEKTENGIINFMQKLGTGYTMYFNRKHKRVGPLFQGSFKAILINNENHLLCLPHYIHTNPLELIMPKWREKGIKSWQKANRFLKNYRWSSYLDCIKIHNFPSVISKDFLSNLWDDPKDYKSGMRDWIESFSLEEIKDITID